jgi:hypothetical protein
LNGPGSGTACAVDTASGLSLHPHEERFDAKVRATFKASDSVEAFVDLWGSHNTTIAAEGFNSINDSTSAAVMGEGRIQRMLGREELDRL